MTYSPAFFQPIGSGSSRSLQTSYVNGTLLMLSKGTPVSVDVSGNILPIDVSNETSYLKFVGLCSTDVPSAASGTVMDAGRLEDLSVGFSIGDSVYVSKSGFLTNIKPDIGVGGFAAGDFVIFVGVIVQNEFDPLKKDLKLFIEKIGQL